MIAILVLLILLPVAALLYYAFAGACAQASLRLGPGAPSVAALFASLALLEARIKSGASFAISARRCCAGMSPYRAFLAGCAVAAFDGLGTPIAYSLFAAPVVYAWSNDALGPMAAVAAIFVDYCSARIFAAGALSRERGWKAPYIVALSAVSALGATISALAEGHWIAYWALARSIVLLPAASLFLGRKSPGAEILASKALVAAASRVRPGESRARLPGPIYLKLALRSLFSEPESALGYALSALLALGAFSAFLWPDAATEASGPIALGAFSYALLGVSFQAIGASALWTDRLSFMCRILPMTFRKALSSIAMPMLLVFGLPFLPVMAALAATKPEYFAALLFDCAAIPLIALFASFRARGFGIMALLSLIGGSIAIGALQVSYWPLGYGIAAFALAASYVKAKEAFSLEEVPT